MSYPTQLQPPSGAPVYPPPPPPVVKRKASIGKILALVLGGGLGVIVLCVLAIALLGTKQPKPAAWAPDTSFSALPVSSAPAASSPPLVSTTVSATPASVSINSANPADWYPADVRALEVIAGATNPDAAVETIRQICLDLDDAAFAKKVRADLGARTPETAILEAGCTARFNAVALKP